MRVTVVDYGVGNMFSVLAALRVLGIPHVRDVDGTGIRGADVVLVPGVAAFGAGMSGLRSTGQAEAILEHAADGRALLGLCLGAQMFLSTSDESVATPGLGIVPGRVAPLDPMRCRVPHQGWARVIADDDLRDLLPSDDYFYFSHSYGMALDSWESPDVGGTAFAETGSETVLAAYRVGATVGVQFHPELSGPAGLSFLERLITSVG